MLTSWLANVEFYFNSRNCLFNLEKSQLSSVVFVDEDKCTRIAHSSPSLSLCLCLCLSVCVSVFLSLSLSLSLYVCGCVFVY